MAGMKDRLVKWSRDLVVNDGKFVLGPCDRYEWVIVWRCNGKKIEDGLPIELSLVVRPDQWHEYEYTQLVAWGAASSVIRNGIRATFFDGGYRQPYVFNYSYEGDKGEHDPVVGDVWYDKEGHVLTREGFSALPNDIFSATWERRIIV